MSTERAALPSECLWTQDGLGPSDHPAGAAQLQVCTLNVLCVPCLCPWRLELQTATFSRAGAQRTHPENLDLACPCPTQGT